jgi:hypothetical protein
MKMTKARREVLAMVRESFGQHGYDHALYVMEMRERAKLGEAGYLSAEGFEKWQAARRKAGEAKRRERTEAQKKTRRKRIQ